MNYLDYIKGAHLGLRRVTPQLIDKFVKVPIGILICLCGLYGVNSVIKLTPVAIPASVICMLLLFLGLLVLEKVVGTRRVSSLLSWLDIPLGFSLRWINIMFTPSFTLLPLAPSVSVGETFKIAAVFVVGYFIMLAGSVYFVWGIQKVYQVRRRPYDADSVRGDSIELSSMTSATSRRMDEEGERTRNSGNTSKPTDHSVSSSEVSEAVEDYAETSGQPSTSNPIRFGYPLSNTTSMGALGFEMEAPKPTAVISRPNNPGMTIPDRCLTGELSTNGAMQQVRETYTGEDSLVNRTAVFVQLNIDWIVYGTLGVIGLIIYLTTGYAIILHLAIVVLTFFSTRIIPPQYRRYLHPIPICGGASIFFIYLFALLRQETVYTNLHAFKTGRNYLTLFDTADYGGVKPGAGDILSSLLDVSIMALAMPMYNYRTDLKRHFFQLVIPSLVAGLASFLIYPPVAYACGIESTRALAFMARSVTLALAMPITAAVGGSSTLISVMAILSGVFGVLFGQTFLGRRWLRVREDDYVTRGISMGICSSAVASAHLLTIDPRAAALSSLSFFLYGVIMIILAAIPPLVTIVRSWVSLGPL
uniref:ARAD1B02156p n=1 Tax=Blastobotrys adeninivorans TaxID=409370 RepID=A0A060T9U2_BLAAD